MRRSLRFGNFARTIAGFVEGNEDAVLLFTRIRRQGSEDLPLRFLPSRFARSSALHGCGQASGQLCPECIDCKHGKEFPPAGTPLGHACLQGG